LGRYLAPLWCWHIVVIVERNRIKPTLARLLGYLT